MSTVVPSEFRKSTPQFNQTELVSRLRERQHPSLKVDDAGVMQVADVEGGFSQLTPLSQLGYPMGDRRDKFRARISVLHTPPLTPGIPNFWRSRYIAPDGTLDIHFHRSGTPVVATLRAVIDGSSNLTDQRVITNATLSCQNIGILREAIGSSGMPSIFPVTSDQKLERRILSVDLQSPRGVPAEEPITALQRHTSEGQLEYLNVPVHAKTIQHPDFWCLPQGSRERIRQVIEEARRVIVADGSAPGALHELVEQTTTLLVQDGGSRSTVSTRYALAARTGLLALIAGYDLHVNCRSGKDRTALFDTEIKFACYQLWRRMQGLPISLPGAAVLPEEKRVWEMLLVKSGNREIQFVNAGKVGNRVSSQLLRERIGRELWRQYVGEAQKAQD